jgi:hypothetical protein
MGTACLEKGREALGDILRGGLWSTDLSVVWRPLDKEATRDGTRCV